MGVTQFVDAQQTQFTQFVDAQQPRFVDAQQPRFVDAQQTQFTQFVEAQQPRFVDAQQSQAEVSLFYLIFWIRNHCTVCLRFSYQFYIVSVLLPTKRNKRPTRLFSFIGKSKR